MMEVQWVCSNNAYEPGMLSNDQFEGVVRNRNIRSAYRVDRLLAVLYPSKRMSPMTSTDSEERG